MMKYPWVAQLIWYTLCLLYEYFFSDAWYCVRGYYCERHSHRVQYVIWGYCYSGIGNEVNPNEGICGYFTIPRCWKSRTCRMYRRFYKQALLKGSQPKPPVVEKFRQTLLVGEVGQIFWVFQENFRVFSRKFHGFFGNFGDFSDLFMIEN